MFGIDKMRKLSLVLIFIVLFFRSTNVEPQFIGFTAGQVVTKTFSIAVAATSSTLSLPNLGQTGHSIQYTWTATGVNCSFNFDGSQDAINWQVLSAGTNSSSVFSSNTYANGYFNFLRIKTNPGNVAGCAGSTLSGSYAGSQSPFPINIVYGNQRVTAITSMVSVLTWPAGTPFFLGGYQCFNPNASTAFLNLRDAASNPGLGGGGHEQGIPAGANFSYTGPPILIANGALWAGAATTLGGVTPVATGLNCMFQTNVFGPFYPFTLSDNP